MSGWEEELALKRRRMVEEQVRRRGVRDSTVLGALERVPRHLFVPEEVLDLSYEDRPLPIGKEQTISQPYIVGTMTEALELGPDDRVLEIGLGSGYQAAVLSELARDVYTVEIVPELARRSMRLLTELGYGNVHVRIGDGRLGWPEEAPFDAILATAAPLEVPPALLEQLAPGGRMVIPIGQDVQDLRRMRKPVEGGPPVVESLMPVRFVPMTGRDAAEGLAAPPPHRAGSGEGETIAPPEPEPRPRPGTTPDPDAPSESGTPSEP
jgi:protein-L-isoaspartate(D-aspartate) O-methyltransferase